MKQLNEQTWNNNILSRASLITDGQGYMRTYDLNNGEILKILKQSDEVDSASQYCRRDEFIFELVRKLKLSKEISDKSIVIPKTVFYDKNDMLVGYTSPKIMDENLDDFLSKDVSLEVYEKVFTSLINKVKLLNKEGIILPDLGNTTNILFNPNNNQFHFIDYDGLQIGDTRAFSIGNILEQNHNPMLFSSKYRNNELFNENLDKLSLLVLYVYYTLDTNIMCNIEHSLTMLQLMNECFSGEAVITPNSAMFQSFFDEFGINDTELSELIQIVFDQTKTNVYPDGAIKKLTKTHLLHQNDDGARYFIKR